SKDVRSSAEIFAQFPESNNTVEWHIAMDEGENHRFMDQLLSAAYFADGNITTIDGMRVDFAQGWGLVRASNSSAALFIRLEADNKETLFSIQEQFKTLMQQIKPDIVLPF
ncbi:MAG: phosphomannomutase/phosphoglucomutase, partial [Methylococcaceae bacterium]|nr:phosphomannomutase/phosphoglucomutase [Methylococcaceae bacterium]